VVTHFPHNTKAYKILKHSLSNRYNKFSCSNVSPIRGTVHCKLQKYLSHSNSPSVQQLKSATAQFFHHSHPFDLEYMAEGNSRNLDSIYSFLNGRQICDQKTRGKVYNQTRNIATNSITWRLH
jgi:hypothetical protein